MVGNDFFSERRSTFLTLCLCAGGWNFPSTDEVLLDVEVESVTVHDLMLADWKVEIEFYGKNGTVLSSEVNDDGGCTKMTLTHVISKLSSTIIEKFGSTQITADGFIWRGHLCCCYFARSECSSLIGISRL